VEVLERAAEVLPDEYWPHFLLAVSKTSRERPELLDLEGALVHAYRAVAIKPESYQALNNLGSALMWLERNEEALFALERAVRLGPWNAQGQGNLGETLRRLGRLPEALAAHERSLELSARATGFLNRALAHKDLGDGGAAEVDVRRALELEPHYTKAWIVLAEALELQGRRDEALQELDRALERLPSSVELEELRARLLDAASGG
jgi:tetratricopeptide (TPR) repeat protein